MNEEAGIQRPPHPRVDVLCVSSLHEEASRGVNGAGDAMVRSRSCQGLLLRPHDRFHTMRLLLVEDDLMIGRAVKHGLELAGFTIDWVTDGESGLAAVANGVYEAVVLDIGLPRLDGLSLLRTARSRRDGVP